MHALRQEIQPASGVEFATSLKLTPSTLDAPRVLCNVVVARSSLLRIFEVRAISQKTLVPTPTVTQFYLIREHRLHGIVTGIEGIKTVSSLDDNLDRLLVSFKDAKVRSCLPKHIHL